MGRILAIDFGRKRTGLAVTDPMKIIASPLTTVATGDLMKYLKDYISQNDVELIVMGHPRQMNGQMSESFKYIEPFVARMKKEMPMMEVVYQDERFTSKLAFSAMLEGGVKKSDRRDKAMVDRISASIILQSYLENQNNKF